MTPAIVRELRRVLDEATIPDAVAGVYLADETETRGVPPSIDPLKP